MSLLGRIRCRFGTHSPNRNKVKQDGGELVGRCRYCDLPIERRAHNDWLPIAEEIPDPTS